MTSTPRTIGFIANLAPTASAIAKGAEQTFVDFTQNLIPLPPSGYSSDLPTSTSGTRKRSISHRAENSAYDSRHNFLEDNVITPFKYNKSAIASAIAATLYSPVTSNTAASSAIAIANCVKKCAKRETSGCGLGAVDSKIGDKRKQLFRQETSTRNEFDNPEEKNCGKKIQKIY